MITVDLGAALAKRIRWAPSPVLETIGWLSRTRDGGTDPTYGRPGAQALELLDRPDVALVAELLPKGDGPTPDFLAPTPGEGPTDGVARMQFAQIRATDPAAASVQVREGLGERRLSAEASSALRDGTLPTRAARGLETFWEQGMTQVWTAAELAVHAEIDRCARLVESGGISAALGAMHGQLSSNGVLQFCEEPAGAERSRAQLLLIPTALYGPTRLAVSLGGAHPFVAYPIARTAAPATSGSELRRLLGPTRASILRELTSARTTTQLSRQLGLAAATVSYHVKVLQRAGLLDRSRDRHSVLYELSLTGRQLLTGMP